MPEKFGQHYSFRPDSFKVPLLECDFSVEISPEAKLRIPALGVVWWKELFSGVVGECFEVPDGQLGNVHIVNSAVKTGVEQQDHSVVTQQVKAVAHQRKKKGKGREQKKKEGEEEEARREITMTW